MPSNTGNATASAVMMTSRDCDHLEADAILTDNRDRLRNRVSGGVTPGFHHSVAVMSLPLREFRKNYVSAVRIRPTLLT